MKHIMNVKTLAATLSSIAFLAACGGGSGGGGAGDANSSSPSAPSQSFAPVKADVLSLSSYENKIASIKAMGSISLIDSFGSVKTNSNESLSKQYMYSNTMAYGDFFGDGNYALMGHTLEYGFSESNRDKLGHIKFYKQSSNGWQEATSDILNDTVGCLHPRKAIVSDFNRDGKPDVFINCTGYDAYPWPGESSKLLLSTQGGKYETKTISWGKSNYTHGSTAADINNDGYPDIVVSDNAPPVRDGTGVLLNNKDGTFTFSSEIFSGIDVNRTSYSVELIKIDGRNAYDLFISGHGNEAGNYKPQLLLNDGHAKFSNAVIFPEVEKYGLALDVIYDSGNFYILRTTDAISEFYTSSLLQKVSYPNASSSKIIYSHIGDYKNGSTWVNWIGFHGSDVVSFDADYDLIVPK